MPHRRFFALLMPALVALAAGCSVLVDPAGTPVRCEARGGFDPCPSPMRCMNYVCAMTRGGDIDAGDANMDAPVDTVPDVIIFVPPDGGETDAIVCLPAPYEICGNGRDDNCNGVMDEGRDVDNDGIAIECSGMGDCNDANPLVNPAMPEVCNGEDDNCNRQADEGEFIGCPSGLQCIDGACVDPSDCSIPGVTCPNPGDVCVGSPAHCEAPRCTSSSCTSSGQVCDPVTGSCIAPRANGETCSDAIQCASRHCYPSAAFAVAGSPITSPVCSQPCCTDAQCMANELCANLGTGARGCLPFSALGLTPPSGSGDAGLMCTSSGECRSASCLPAPKSRCLQQCSGDGECPTGFSCTRQIAERTLAGGTLTELSIASCLPRSDLGAGDYGAMCMTSGDCASNYCVSSGTMSTCSKPCRVSSDCGGMGWYCGTVRFAVGPSGAPTRMDSVQLCLYRSDIGTAGNGEPCSTDTQCASGVCSRGQCSDACCVDADCGARAHCDVSMRGGGYSMRCRPDR